MKDLKAQSNHNKAQDLKEKLQKKKLLVLLLIIELFQSLMLCLITPTLSKIMISSKKNY